MQGCPIRSVRRQLDPSDAGTGTPCLVRRLLEPIGNIRPAKAEANFYAALKTEDMAVSLKIAKFYLTITIVKLKTTSRRKTRRGLIPLRS